MKIKHLNYYFDELKILQEKETKLRLILFLLFLKLKDNMYQ